MIPRLRESYATWLQEGISVPPLTFFQFILVVLKGAAPQGKAAGTHLSPAKLCALLSRRVDREFGPFAGAVLRWWGVKNGEDVGRAVFLLGRQGLLKLSGRETLEDFRRAEWAQPA